MGEAKRRSIVAALAGTTTLKSAAGLAAAQKREIDRNVVGVALLKMVDDAILFGLPPIDAVRALHHAFAATVARYYGASGASVIKPYGDALPGLVAQYAEAATAKKSPLVILPDGTPAVAANESDTKH